MKLVVKDKQFRYKGEIYFPGETFECDNVEELAQPIMRRKLDVVRAMEIKEDKSAEVKDRSIRTRVKSKKNKINEDDE